jgi:hypothetical protein
MDEGDRHWLRACLRKLAARLTTPAAGAGHLERENAPVTFAHPSGAFQFWGELS